MHEPKSFELTDFIGSSTPPYAILSHTWGDEEVRFGEIGRLNGTVRAKKRVNELRRCCERDALG
jgi:hypothetical protein